MPKEWRVHGDGGGGEQRGGMPGQWLERQRDFGLGWVAVQWALPQNDEIFRNISKMTRRGRK